MPPDLALLSTLSGSNYPCLELVFMVPKVFEPLKFDRSLMLQCVQRMQLVYLQEAVGQGGEPTSRPRANNG